MFASFAEPHKTDAISTGAMMAAAGGFLDAFTYIGHGHVFANAMTGNVVLLGVALGGGNWPQALRHAVPIAAFIAGIVFARVLDTPPVRRVVAGPHLACMIVEIAALLVVGFLPATFPDTALTLSIAFVASMQLATFPKVRGAPYASTFTTGNLRKFAESAFAFATDRADADAGVLTRAFAAICAAFLAGACAGAAATTALHNRAAWVVCAWLVLVSMRLFARRRAAPSAQAAGLNS